MHANKEGTLSKHEGRSRVFLAFVVWPCTQEREQKPSRSYWCTLKEWNMRLQALRHSWCGHVLKERERAHLCTPKWGWYKSSSLQAFRVHSCIQHKGGHTSTCQRDEGNSFKPSRCADVVIEGMILYGEGMHSGGGVV